LQGAASDQIVEYDFNALELDIEAFANKDLNLKAIGVILQA